VLSAAVAAPYGVRRCRSWAASTVPAVPGIDNNIVNNIITVHDSGEAGNIDERKADKEA